MKKKFLLPLLSIFIVNTCVYAGKDGNSVVFYGGTVVIDESFNWETADHRTRCQALASFNKNPREYLYVVESLLMFTNGREPSTFGTLYGDFAAIKRNFLGNGGDESLFE